MNNESKQLLIDIIDNLVKLGMVQSASDVVEELKELERDSNCDNTIPITGIEPSN